MTLKETIDEQKLIAKPSMYTFGITLTAIHGKSHFKGGDDYKNLESKVMKSRSRKKIHARRDLSLRVFRLKGRWCVVRDVTRVTTSRKIVLSRSKTQLRFHWRMLQTSIGKMLDPRQQARYMTLERKRKRFISRSIVRGKQCLEMWHDWSHQKRLSCKCYLLFIDKWCIGLQAQGEWSFELRPMMSEDENSTHILHRRNFCCLRYARGVQGYILWDIVACKIFVSSNIFFNESRSLKEESVPNFHSRIWMWSSLIIMW